MNPSEDDPTEFVEIDSPGEPATESGGRSSGLIGLAVLAVAGVALLAIFFSGGDSTSTSDAAGAGEPAGADGGSGLGELGQLAFTNPDGSEGDLTDFEGEPLVVNFFASWCAPCRAELPHFEEVHVESDGKVQFIGVSHDIDQGSWLGLVDEVSLTYPTVFQPEQEIWETLNLFGMPATAFITPDGEVVHTFAGVLDQESLKQLIAEHLNVEV